MHIHTHTHTHRRAGRECSLRTSALDSSPTATQTRCSIFGTWYRASVYVCVWTYACIINVYICILQVCNRGTGFIGALFETKETFKMYSGYA
jgi:hypothetical protein